MKKISFKAHPILTSILLTILAGGILFLPLKSLFITITGEFTEINKLQVGFLARSIFAFLFVFIIYRLKLKSFLICKWEIKNWYIIWPFVILILINSPVYSYLTDGIPNFNSSIIIWTALKDFGVGIFEEFIFRGAILTILLYNLASLKNGIYKSVLFSSLLFGCLHLINIIKGADPADTIGQVFYAACIGLILAAIFLKTENIWLVVILHALFDFVDDLPVIATADIWSNIDIVINVILFIPFALYGLFLLRSLNKKKYKASENFDNQSIN